MSQYPPPYPPQYPYSSPYPPPDPLAPAKKAATLMFVLGALLAVFGACFAVAGLVITPEQMEAEQARVFRQLEAEFGIPLQTLFMLLALFTMVPGLLLILLGFFVRRGGMVAIVLSMIVAAAIALFQLVNTIGMVADPQMMAGPGVVNLCVPVIMLALFGLLLVWLFQAARAVPQVRAMREQQQSQYWQYHQYQQQPPSYPPGGYIPPQAPPPTAPPPDQDRS